MYDVLEEEGPSWSKLHAHDQLREEQQRGRALAGFNETPPDFAPTFKKLKSKNRDHERISVAGGDGRTSLGGVDGGKGPKRPTSAFSGANLAGTLKGMKGGKKADCAVPVGTRAATSRPSPRSSSRVPALGSLGEGDEGEEGEEDVAFGLGASVGGGEADEDEAPLLNDDDAGADEGGERARRLGYNPQRIPSWCDRVLWRSYPMCGCEQTAYRAVETVDTSDHTPVYATYTVRSPLHTALGICPPDLPWCHVAGTGDAPCGCRVQGDGGPLSVGALNRRRRHLHTARIAR